MRVAAAILLAILGSRAVRAQVAPDDANPSFFQRYIAMVERAQDGQPHWISPLITTTPRVNQRFRNDITGQSRPNDVDLTNYGSSKGVELIVAEPVAVTFGIPAYLVRDSPRGRQTGWADETFLAKYRFASANEEHGNYVVSAFLGVSVPTGS